MQFHKSVSYQKNEAVLLITTLPCLKVFASVNTKNKSKSSWHTEKFAKNHLKEKSSGRMRTKRQNRKVYSSLRYISSSPGHWQTFKLLQQSWVLSDRRIDFQTTLSSGSQLELRAGKPLTSSSTVRIPRQELRTTSPQGTGMKGSATSEGQIDKFFRRTKVLKTFVLQKKMSLKVWKRQRDRLPLSCMHGKKGDAAVTITTEK